MSSFISVLSRENIPFWEKVIPSTLNSPIRLTHWPQHYDSRSQNQGEDHAHEDVVSVMRFLTSHHKLRTKERLSEKQVPKRE
jgi:hypothetical protein